MTLNEKGEIEWVQPNKETTDLYRAGIAYHLHQQFQKVFQPKQENNNGDR